MMILEGKAVSLNISEQHKMSKLPVPSVEVIEGEGIVGDAHRGKTVKHVYLMKKYGRVANLRQVHLIPSELYTELNEAGFSLSFGEMGENITTAGLDLIRLPLDTVLIIGDVTLRVTGLREPCKQLDDLRPGLLKAVLDKDQEGKIIRKTGVMTVVESGGTIKQYQTIQVVLPQGKLEPLTTKTIP